MVWLIAVGALSCSPPPESSPSSGGYLFQKGPYQALYGKDGHIIRLLHDENGDGRPESVTVFRPNGRPERVEIDTDGDGVVDRWEYLGQSGLEKIGSSTKKPGKPDLWVYTDASGAVTRRDLDEDGNGSVDRIERYLGSRLVKVEVDGDGDGRIDRWQDWGSGRLAAEELDTDGDGRPDRRLRYTLAGNVAAIEPMSAFPSRPGPVPAAPPRR
jgi:hypothetical protein